MHDGHQDESEIFRFILDEIDNVPQLEALLLLWHSHPSPWAIDDLAKRLYVSPELAREILLDLARKQLITVLPGSPESYYYESVPEGRDRLMARIDATYRRQIVRVSTMIHAKPSSAVRDFARAFRFTKERDRDKEKE